MITLEAERRADGYVLGRTDEEHERLRAQSRLLVQDYDLRGVSVQPGLDSFEEVGRIIIEAFTAAGCDVHVGTSLPGLTTETQAATTLATFACDAERFPERPTLWPLLIGAWKRKPTDAESELTR